MAYDDSYLKYMGIGQIRRHIGTCEFGINQLTELYVALAVILINDIYVANPYSLNSYFVCQNV